MGELGTARGSWSPQHRRQNGGKEAPSSMVATVGWGGGGLRGQGWPVAQALPVCIVLRPCVPRSLRSPSAASPAQPCGSPQRSGTSQPLSPQGDISMTAWPCAGGGGTGLTGQWGGLSTLCTAVQEGGNRGTGPWVLPSWTSPWRARCPPPPASRAVWDRCDPLRPPELRSVLLWGWPRVQCHHGPPV